MNPKDDLLTKCKSKTETKASLFKCTKCDKQFKMAHRLDAHIRQHYGLKVLMFIIYKYNFVQGSMLVEYKDFVLF